MCPHIWRNHRALSVCWSVKRTFDDLQDAPYWQTWPCVLFFLRFLFFIFFLFVLFLLFFLFFLFFLFLLLLSFLSFFFLYVFFILVLFSLFLLFPLTFFLIPFLPKENDMVDFHQASLPTKLNTSQHT